MRFPLLFALALAFVFPAFGQAQFSGEYIGVATPVRFVCPERVIVDVFVSANGLIDVFVMNFDLDDNYSYAATTIYDNGSFFVAIGDGYSIYGKVSKSGALSGFLLGDCKYTFKALRRFRYPYAP